MIDFSISFDFSSHKKSGDEKFKYHTLAIEVCTLVILVIINIRM